MVLLLSLIPLPKAFSCFFILRSHSAFIPSLISIFQCCILLHSILKALSSETNNFQGRLSYFSLSLSACFSLSCFQGKLDNVVPVNTHFKLKIQKFKKSWLLTQVVTLPGTTYWFWSRDSFYSNFAYQVPLRHEHTFFYWPLFPPRKLYRKL